MPPKKDPVTSSPQRSTMSQPAVTVDDLRHILNELRSTTPTVSETKGSFSRCTTRFAGERDPTKVDEFITTVSIYKNVEHISDEDALGGLPLLFQGFAATWWQGVKGEARTWEEACALIRNAFSPSKSSATLYMELFSSTQSNTMSTDEFVCNKRAILSQLPTGRHNEETQIDMIYGMLKLEIRKRISREEVKTFSDLLRKARQVEQLLVEIKSTNKENSGTTTTATKPKNRCKFCGFKGHVIDECRKRLRKEQTKVNRATPAPAAAPIAPSTTPITQSGPGLSCYGCGTPGYYRSNCPQCSAKKENVTTNAIQFYSLNAYVQLSTEVPTVPVTINGIEGVAHLDTAAKTSIASQSLYKKLKQNGASIHPRKALVTLADGSHQERNVLSTTVDIIIGGRKMLISLLILPDAKDNRTLLGIDFLTAAGMVMHLPQRVWMFADEMNKHHLFLDVDKGKTPEYFYQAPAEPTSSSVTVDEEVESSPALRIHTSPLPITPTSNNEECSKTTSPFLTYFEENNTSQHQEPARYALRRIDTPEKRVREATNYSPGAIDRIFEDTLPITYSPPKIDPRTGFDCKRPKLQFDAIDIKLRSDEALCLSEMEKEVLNVTLEAHADTFNDNGPPTTATEHRINTGNHAPISVPPYRLSPKRQEFLKGKINEMLENNIIEESDTPWTAPIVLVPKKNGDLRVCVDYRQLNAITVPDRYPLPRIDDLLHAAKCTQYMSTLDLQSGYWQIPIFEDDRDKSGFITPFGVYRFNRMPFGLRNAPSTFQRMMDRVKVQASDLCLLIYLDDLILLSSTYEKHVQDLEKLFGLLKQHNLRINRFKSHLCCTSVKFLGHVLTPKGIATSPEKIDSILSRAPPRNVKELLSFIQVCSWYRRFVSNFADIARPLTQLTKKNCAWKWDTEQEEAFDGLKKRLTSAPILAQADDTKPFIIKTDASSYAIGAVLIQGERGDEHPIEYSSRLLTSAERNYTTTEREALALIWATHKFRGYIEGSEVIITTDHQPLRWLMSIKTPTGRLARWALQLQPFNLQIKYEPGRSNVVADFLSRPPSDEPSYELNLVEIDIPTRGEKDMRQAQLLDEVLKEIITTLESSKPDELYQKWLKRGYFLHNGVLYRYTEEQEDDAAKLLVSKAERLAILKAFHDDPTAGHYGIDKTIERISRRYYWQGMRKDVAAYIGKCQDCQRYKIQNRKPTGLVQTTTVNQRFEILSIDLFGPLPESETGERWIFVIEDVATRWIELFALKDATAENCATILLNEIFLRYGLPRRVTSDNGTQFISAVMQKLLFCLDIHPSFTPVYHPESNIVERKNRDLKTQLGILVKNEHTTWPQYLPSIRFSMNSVLSESTGYTAAYLNFGREMRTPQDTRDDFSALVSSENFVPAITPQLEKLAKVLTDAKEITELRQDRNQRYTSTHHDPAPQYDPGTRVWISTHSLSKASKGYTSKFAPKRDGPYLILHKLGTATYEVASLQQPTIPIGKYHVSAISPYHGNDEVIPAPVQPIRRRGRPRKRPQLERSTRSATYTDDSSGRPRRQRGRL